MDNSWIKIYRGIQDNWIFENPMYLKAWITILFNVNIKPSKTMIDGQLIHCKRGESIRSVDSWVKLFGKNWTRQKARTFLNLLKNDKMITIEGLAKTTKLSVCKYGDYQDKQPTKNQQVTNSQPTGNHNIRKEERKERKKECLEYAYRENSWYNFNAVSFFEKHDSNDWEGVLNWKKKMITWKSNNYDGPLKKNSPDLEIFLEWVKTLPTEEAEKIAQGVFKCLK